MKNLNLYITESLKSYKKLSEALKDFLHLEEPSINYEYDKKGKQVYIWTINPRYTDDCRYILVGTVVNYKLEILGRFEFDKYNTQEKLINKIEELFKIKRKTQSFKNFLDDLKNDNVISNGKHVYPTYNSELDEYAKNYEHLSSLKNLSVY